MILNLRRTERLVTGIIGELLTEDWKPLYFTLEHAYVDGDEFVSKIPIGTYKCVRGEHTLEHHPEPFTTFEVTNVPGHTHILFHVGNINSDSAGCILLGLETDHKYRVSSSYAAWCDFMTRLSGLDEFTLNVFG